MNSYLTPQNAAHGVVYLRNSRAHAPDSYYFERLDCPPFLIEKGLRRNLLRPELISTCLGFAHQLDNMNIDNSGPLSQANQRWHLLLDSNYQQFLEALTALDYVCARQQWLLFKQSLDAHIDFEQRNIEPLAAPWEDNIHKLIQSDHLILNRLMPRLDTALDSIEQSEQPRAELVRSLDGFIKMRNVLTHHDLREMEQLYPILDQQLDAARAQALADAMDTSLKVLTVAAP